MNRLYLLLIGLLIIPITIYAQSIEPDPDQPIGPVTNVGLEYKFDPGFYNKILDIMDDPVIEGDPGVFDGTRYYDTILVISRGGIDGDLTAKQNKESLLIKLNEIGARDIYVAEVLSFITASIPVGEVPGISIHDEVYALGDGEQEFTVDVDQARRTINAEYNTLNQIQTNLNGSGVTVAVVDSGIKSVHFNDKVKKRIYCPDDNCWNGTNLQSTNDLSIGVLNYIEHTHGTQVAQIIAISSMSGDNGIAPGVDLLDAMWGYKEHVNDIEIISHSSAFVRSLDWSHKNGADVVNLSASGPQCVGFRYDDSFSLIINELVDKGVVVVKTAGNTGFGVDSNNMTRNFYNTIGNPGCAENVITVGGTNNRLDEMTMFNESSRGPGDGIKHILKPDLVAPANKLITASNSIFGGIVNVSGTSFAAPQVTSAVALMLQLDPTLTPVEVKSLLLLSANWTGPVPCTSSQYEQNNPNDNCSWARQPTDFEISKKLDILNNVGHGVLDIGQTLQYIKNGKHIIHDYLDINTQSKNYTINIKNIKDPTKILLTWLVHPHGSIKDQSYVSRANIGVPVSNLDFTVQCKDGTTYTVNSVNQTVEFIVFQPTSKGKCTITVSGTNLDDINKPVQNFALSSTVPFKIKNVKSDTPRGITDTLYISKETYTPIHISSFYDGIDIVQYKITQEPTQGTLSAIEFLTNNRSRVTYTPNHDFTGNDSFQFVPYIDNKQGDPTTITLLPENLPPHTVQKEILYNKLHNIFMLNPTFNRDANQYVYANLININYNVESILVESNNVDNAFIKINTNDNEIYRMVIPHDDSRMITFDNPMLITNIELLYEWIDESELSITNTTKFNAVIGLVAENNNNNTLLKVIEHTNQNINNTNQYVKLITINQSGHIVNSMINVNVTHNNINELEIILRTPTHKNIIIDQTNMNITDYILNHNIKGDWTLIINDLVNNNQDGRINDWSLNFVYKPDIIDINPIKGNIIFHEIFDNLDRWTQTGNEMSIVNKLDDRHKTFALHNKTDNFLQIGPCEECKLTLKNGIDLSNYTEVMLLLWRYVPLPYDSDGTLMFEMYIDDHDDSVSEYYLSDFALGWWHRDFMSLRNYEIDNNNTIVFTNTFTNKTSYIDDIMIIDGRIEDGDYYVHTYIVDRNDNVISVFDGDLYITDIDINNITTSSRLTGIDHFNNNLYISDTKNNKIYRYDIFQDKLKTHTSTLKNPKGLEGNDYYKNELYVATSKGIEKINNKGKSLGLFGDAKRIGGTNNTFPITTSDVTICKYDGNYGDTLSMYVVDNIRNIIYNYDKNGNYLNKIKIDGDITYITCKYDHYNNNINNVFLYVSINNEQQDYLSKISISNHNIIQNITSNINNPQGIDMGYYFEYDNKLHLVNNNSYYIIDDNEITKSNKLLNKPTDLALGHYYFRTSEHFDTVSNENIIENNRPIIVTPKDTQIFKVIQNDTITINVQSTDQDNDSLTLSVEPDMIPQNNINLTDNGNGIGTVQINTNLPVGDYIFWIQSNDGTNDDEVQLMLEIR